MADSLVVRGGTVLVGNPLEERFVDADVLLRDGRIAEIGSVPSDGAPEIDARGTFVLPGFVDSHHHLWEASMRGLTADWDITQFMARIRSSYAKFHTAQDIHAGTLSGAVAALDCGVTTSIDYMHCVNTPEHAEASVDAISEVGIRSVFCYGLNAVPLDEPWFTTHADRLDDARRMRSTRFAVTDPAELITFGIAASDLGSRPAEITDAEFALARELDVLLTVHTDCLWSPDYPQQVAELHTRGLLGPKQLYAHANRTTNAELALLADAGSAVASTPEVELQMGNGFPVLKRASRHGVPAGLGSNLQANNSPDLFTQMRLARHSITAIENQPLLETTGTAALDGTSLTCAQAFFHATLDSARALGLDAVTGSLEVGKAADLMLLRNDGVHHRPIVDPMATIVSQSRPSDVDTVVVAGVVKKQSGRVDDALRRRAISLADGVFERVRSRSTPLRRSGH
ncbi:amidohydrolase family protein [Rhodococcus opacus]|uniref:Amidohydrolase family protein n=1 Tax=Rhodococcus opacus TaxID=37919 RepID=A0AAX3YU83_RHOOP|nr:amidohydrolase family protein [Rhodococcus opacus]MCZ4585964.1 amidohydrolase family protein [Rhodococcus opacus]WLF52080.1 amidohydrolase family protein [Rhodococcus opacus]